MTITRTAAGAVAAAFALVAGTANALPDREPGRYRPVVTGRSEAPDEHGLGDQGQEKDVRGIGGARDVPPDRSTLWP